MDLPVRAHDDFRCRSFACRSRPSLGRRPPPRLALAALSPTVSNANPAPLRSSLRPPACAAKIRQSERPYRAASNSRRIFSVFRRLLFGPVPPVKAIPPFNRSTFETCIFFPFLHAPSPRYAHHRMPSAGALAIPATISPSRSIPSNVPNVAIPRENSSVPSMGSMINRARPVVAGAFAFSPPISSPRTSIANPLAATLARAISSTPRSACVTADAIVLSCRCEFHPPGKNASQSHPPPSQVLPATAHTLLGIPFRLPATSDFASNQVPDVLAPSTSTLQSATSCSPPIDTTIFRL